MRLSRELEDVWAYAGTAVGAAGTAYVSGEKCDNDSSTVPAVERRLDILPQLPPLIKGVCAI